MLRHTRLPPLRLFLPFTPPYADSCCCLLIFTLMPGARYARLPRAMAYSSYARVMRACACAFDMLCHVELIYARMRHAIFFFFRCAMPMIYAFIMSPRR